MIKVESVVRLDCKMVHAFEVQRRDEEDAVLSRGRCYAFKGGQHEGRCSVLYNMSCLSFGEYYDAFKEGTVKDLY